MGAVSFRASVLVATLSAMGAGCVTHSRFRVSANDYALAMRRLEAGSGGGEPLRALSADSLDEPPVWLKTTHTTPVRGRSSPADPDELLVLATDLSAPHLAAGWTLFGFASVMVLGATTRLSEDDSDGTAYGLIGTAGVLLAFAAWQLAVGYGDAVTPYADPRSLGGQRP